MSAKYIYDLIEYIKDKDVAINVISKSGTTLEPAMSFRILRMFLEEKYGIRGAAQRIYVTTDANKGVLHDIAVKNEYEMFVIPDNVGGRYSVLTPVGLLPMAVANIDIDDILDGALFASHVFNQRNIKANDCYKYAIIRNVLYQKGKTIELLASYEPSLGILSNGINNYLVRVREKKIKEFFQLELILQLTFIQWDNLYNREQGIYLKL